jgi:hypothetical protein
MAKLTFDGKTYPNNPAIEPAIALDARPQASLIVPISAKGLPLYK